MSYSQCENCQLFEGLSLQSKSDSKIRYTLSHFQTCSTIFTIDFLRPFKIKTRISILQQRRTCVIFKNLFFCFKFEYEQFQFDLMPDLGLSPSICTSTILEGWRWPGGRQDPRQMDQFRFTIFKCFFSFFINFFLLYLYLSQFNGFLSFFFAAVCIPFLF